MAAASYAAALEFTLKFEGGYVNHPKDPGGATNYGVTQATYNRHRASKGLGPQAVRKITIAEVREIYRKGYWNAVKGDLQPAGVDAAVFDFGVNSGPARALKYLARAMPAGDAAAVAKKLCRDRLAFVRGLKTWSTFGKGWLRRITALEAFAVKLALSKDHTPAAVHDKLQEEAHAAGKASRTAKRDAATTGATTGGTAAASPLAGWESWEIALAAGVAVAVGVLATVILLRRARIAAARKRAYLETIHA